MDGDQTPRPRRTAPKEVRRQQLIDATIDTIAELGVSRATMTEITGRAGLSIGIVNLHFDSKDNLLKATLTHLAEELRLRWGAIHADAALGPAQKLWGVIGAAFDADIATRNKMRCWFGFFGEARYRAFYREMVAAYDDERAAVVEALLRDLAADGAPPAVDPHALTQSLECLSDGLWLGMMLYPDWVDPDAARQRLWELLSSHFPARFPPGATAAMDSVR
ncbi:TetR family transcriptional regulator C-terminal domain-containing protein [Rubrimonas sp.]|uniref:TetR family transcriptional regulator C-terminal domain-containing protein n=1 Tax=Rubrimonas sp. TaxID=2036015 RepID=UPI002FDE0FA5